MEKILKQHFLCLYLKTRGRYAQYRWLTFNHPFIYQLQGQFSFEQFAKRLSGKDTQFPSLLNYSPFSFSKPNSRIFGEDLLPFVNAFYKDSKNFVLKYEQEKI